MLGVLAICHRSQKDWAFGTSHMVPALYYRFPGLLAFILYLELLLLGVSFYMFGLCSLGFPFEISHVACALSSLTCQHFFFIPYL